MNTKEAIRGAMSFGHTVLKAYIGDLSDAELLNRPGPGCNHLAWQLGHLIESERGLLESIAPGAGIELPADFVAQRAKENAESNDPAKFYGKQQYLDLLDKVRAATLAALDKTSDADFDQPGPERFRKFFPTVGSVYLLIAAHPLMHAGQFVPVRRALGKPIII